MHNLIANSPADSRFGQGAYIYQVTARTRTGNHSLFNNLFVNHKTMLDINYPSHRGGPQRLDHNVYDASADERAFCVNRAADKPSPWSPAEFLELIRTELGGDSTGVVLSDNEKCVMLTLDQWRAFWAKHDLQNDRGSVVREGMAVAYNPDKYELTINVPFDPATIGSTDHRWIDNDFFGRPVPQDGRALPGPFQDLKQDKNRFRVWSGLPTLERGELPRIASEAND